MEVRKESYSNTGFHIFSFIPTECFNFFFYFEYFFLKKTLFYLSASSHTPEKATEIEPYFLSYTCGTQRKFNTQLISSSRSIRGWFAFKVILWFSKEGPNSTSLNSFYLQDIATTINCWELDSAYSKYLRNIYFCWWLCSA